MTGDSAGFRSGSCPTWLAWAREIQALGQTGLAYSQSDYDRQRYQRLVDLAAEIVAVHTDLPAHDALQSFSVQPGYATAKVDVRGAVVRDRSVDHRVLLVRERSDGCWSMPGGWADVGELPSEMVAREVREESGFDVVAERVVGVYDANRGGEPLEFYHAYKVVFLCRIVGGEARPSDETSEVGFFAFDALPTLSPARTNERHLADLQRHLSDSTTPASFD